MQEYEQITTGKQNQLAKLYPFWFDSVPDQVPFPLHFGSDYSIQDEQSLVSLLKMKGQKILQVHEKGIEFQSQCVLSSSWVEKRARKLRQERNFEQRVRAGAVKPGSLGIVGNNLDNRNTYQHEKEMRADLYRTQNAIQKIRLGPDPKKIKNRLSYYDSGQKIVLPNPDLVRRWHVPQKFEPIPLKNPIVSQAVCSCGTPLNKQVIVNRNTEHNSASISGVATCGSVWACPVCRAKKIAKRAEELKELYREWKGQGKHIYMLTLTVPHKKTDNLTRLYGNSNRGKGLSGALSKFRASRIFGKDFKDEVNYLGDVRGIEVTWGRSNGFHPHIHMLIFCEHTFSFEKWNQKFYSAWLSACERAGLRAPSFENGVDLQYCKDTEQAQYLAKWSSANELQSAGMKSAKSGNFSIAELERCLWDKELRQAKKIGIRESASVLRAYYGAMRGQRMLQTGGIGPEYNWKRDILEKAGQDELNPDVTEPLADLEYRVYIKLKRRDRLSEFLEMAERGKTNRHRRQNMREWLQRNGYDPNSIENPDQNSPPPAVLGYPTGYEPVLFKEIMKDQAD